MGPQNKPSEAVPSHGIATTTAEGIPLPDSLVGVALLVLNTAEPNVKAAVTHRGWKAYCLGQIPGTSAFTKPAATLPLPAEAAAHARAILVAQQQQQHDDHERGDIQRHRSLTNTMTASGTLMPPSRPAQPRQASTGGPKRRCPAPEPHPCRSMPTCCTTWPILSSMQLTLPGIL